MEPGKKQQTQENILFREGLCMGRPICPLRRKETQNLRSASGSVKCTSDSLDIVTVAYWAADFIPVCGHYLGFHRRHLVSLHILSDPSPLLLPFLPLSAALGRIKPYSQNWVVWALLKFAATAKPDNLVLTDHCISSAQKFLAPSDCQARGWSDSLSPH